jgi:hypothetical protein
MTEDIPGGTVAEILEWVGSDPARAQGALDAEYAGANRTTLIAQLEPIATKEATEVTDPISDETALAPGPQAPEVSVDVDDASTTVLPTVFSSPDVDYEQDYTGEPVESLGGAVAPHGFVLVLNGEGFIFSPQMVASLKAIVQTAATGVTL